MKKYTAEFMATFALIFCGTGAMVVNETTHGAIGHIGVAIGWGLIVMIMIYAFGEISGAHMNPAVTIAFAINKNFPWNKVLPYTISQLLGAVSASLLLKFLFPTSMTLGATLPSGSIMQSFVLEIFLMLLLMLVVLQVAVGSKEQGMFAGMAIGGVVLLEAMFAGPISGASMNPIRSLAPALVSNHLEHVWIYLTAPFIGAAGAVFVHQFFKKIKYLFE
ncbi:MAG: MIP family channel protein [Chitinophagaceae bacterium]|nr:MIP family channel protein [Chitinophagaceae bacterium]